MSEWVKCSERMPKEGEEVIVTFDNGSGVYVSAMAFGSNLIPGALQKWHSIDDESAIFDHLIVTHWMPMPEPAKEQPHA